MNRRNINDLISHALPSYKRWIHFYTRIFTLWENIWSTWVFIRGLIFCTFIHIKFFPYTNIKEDDDNIYTWINDNDNLDIVSIEWVIDYVPYNEIYELSINSKFHTKIRFSRA